ncbi:hypothetical protein B0H15DRAFT_1025521 [Mycena belliarum]|uniref:Uncharacterized protein n=1 Tax=Mycena belliarum TaxID=1033014 RepID=A0AAD6TVU3_9AGAR|nr:hypothetical protein B0H15DRAFT_1025521 [Mycena belliae]
MPTHDSGISNLHRVGLRASPGLPVLAVLYACPVIQDDDDDLGNRRAPLVDRCTDGDRYTGNNARNLEVHTAHCGTRCASVWVGVPPNSTVETPASAASTRLAVGDWVLCQGTLHNRWTPVFDDPRQYELLASRVYVLPFEDVDESSSTATLSATETPSQSGPSKRERSTSPIEGRHCIWRPRPKAFPADAAGWG